MTQARSSFLVSLALAATCLLATTACVSVRNPFGSGNKDGLTAEQLRTKLYAFSDNWALEVETEYAAAIAEAPDAATRRELLARQIRLVPVTRRIVSQRDPRAAFLDLWTFAYQLRDLMQSDRPTSLSPEHVDRLRKQAATSLEDIEAIALVLLGEDDLPDAREDIMEFARENPLRESLARRGPSPDRGDDSGFEVFGWVSEVPLINAFDGLDAGAQAIREFTVVAEQFARAAVAIPQETRWHLELLLYDFDASATATSTREVMEALPAEITRLVDSAEKLPAEVRAIVDDSLQNLEQQQEGLNAIVTEARLALTELDEAMQRADPVSASLERSAASVARAGVALEGMAVAFMGPPEDPAPPAEVAPTPAVAPAPEDEDDEGGFEVEAYGESADSIAVAATELRELVREIREMAAGGELASSFGELDVTARGTVDHANEQAKVLVDRMTLRGLLLIGAALAAAIAYRLITRRWLTASR